MKKNFLVIIAFVLLTPFVFLNCDDKKDPPAELTIDNMTDLIEYGLYGKVKSVIGTSYDATWNAATKQPDVPTEFRSRSTITFNEQGFLTSEKIESYRIEFTIAADKKSATATRQLYNNSDMTTKFDAKNRPIEQVESLSWSSSSYPMVKINFEGVEETVNLNDNYFTHDFDPEGNINKITVKEDMPDLTIVGFVYDNSERTYTYTYVYDDAAKTAIMTEVRKLNGVTEDSTVTTYQLLANGRIDESTGEGIEYRPSPTANQPVSKTKDVVTKDEKGNMTLFYSLRTPYKEDDGTLDEENTRIDGYMKVEYQYWQ